MKKFFQSLNFIFKKIVIFITGSTILIQILLILLLTFVIAFTSTSIFAFAKDDNLQKYPSANTGDSGKSEGIAGDTVAVNNDEKKSNANALPLFELGAGFLYLNMNHYRGSDQTASYLWPLPFFIYRGENVYAKNSMVQGNIYEKGDFSLGLSMMASLRVSSAENHAREGMPTLDPTLEIGPVAEWTFWRDKNNLNTLSVSFPIRAVNAVDFFYAKYEGCFSVPFVSLSSYPQDYTLGFFSEITMAVMWGSARYHNYFYGVSEEYVRENRPKYNASAGYSGAHATWWLSKKFDPFYLYGFYRYDRLNRAVFIDSPLVKQKDYHVMGVGLIWYFYQTKAMSARRQ
ncbi:MAG: MipA/OmpV family protein [Oligoflexia bacterium]|nr:MipA/OmpV family protein [Oligoflexia bacterium]